MGGKKKIGIESLEPCNVNPAIVCRHTHTGSPHRRVKSLKHTESGSRYKDMEDGQREESLLSLT